MTLRARKRRAPQSELHRLTHDSRQLLYGWFREDNGEIKYEEVQRRIKEHFGFSVGFATLSKYYNNHYWEILGVAVPGAAPTTKTIIIRIQVPAGCSVDVSASTEDEAKTGAAAS